MLKFIKRVLFLIVVMALMFSIPAFAARIGTFGNYNTGARIDNSYDMEVSDSGLITVNGGFVPKIEVVTTNNTITITESGTTYIVEGVFDTSSVTVFQLPECEETTVGAIDYTFIVGGAMTPSVANTSRDLPTVDIEPTDSDIIYHINSVAATTFAAGDKIYSTGKTADSIRLICAADGIWYTTDVRGTWADGN